MGQFSRTWWGQRFIEALERFTDSARLGRGRSYASGGRILDYTIADDQRRRLDQGHPPDCVEGGPGHKTADERDA